MKKTIIIFVILFLTIVWGIPCIIFALLNKNTVLTNTSASKVQIHNIVDLYKAVTEDVIYSIEIENDYIYDNDIDIKLAIQNFDDENDYRVQVSINNESVIEKEIIEKENLLKIEFDKEGRKDINIKIYLNEEEKVRFDKTIYYIRAYQKQFLDEFSQIGICTHFGLNSSSKDNIDKSLKLLKALGTKWVRDSIRWDKVQMSTGEFNFFDTDAWVNKLKENDINLLAILAGTTKLQAGEDYEISNDKELQKFETYANQVSNRYPFIKRYEIFNEPNIKMKEAKQKQWYAKTVISARNSIGYNSEIIAGSTMVPYKNEEVSLNWIKDIANYGAYKFTDIFSYHPYASIEDLEKTNKIYKIGVNELGGFTKLNVTEYGKKTSDEEDFSEILIKQSIENQSKDVELSTLYQFRTNNSNSNYDYGLLNNDYTPKPAYYAMKNFYENTNGAEYVGTVDITDGLEVHVYNKDGKPKIIAWTTKAATNINIKYQNFIAKDIYGEIIEADENSNLTITTSPVYLENMSNTYFYKAIANTVLAKYNEFQTRFAEQIEKVPNLSDNIQHMKNYITSVGNTESVILENASLQAMQIHYEFGKQILQAYKDGNLEVEYVKLSSMLDMLDDIGNSYEDLVTVSAKTRNADLEQTNKTIQEVDVLINNNQDLDIIYPNKILEFSKDYYEKAEYINNLEEENDIKTGLIISKNLHSKFLAEWAKGFADLYIDKYIAENPVTIEYSETNLTNQDITAKLITNAEIEVTNNSKSKEYTFKENGNFTFAYTIRGRAFKIEANVENIDKTPPVIDGVEEGKIYTKHVTPIISDENLLKIEIQLNGEIIENYQPNIPIEEDGFYKITATDKVGNITTINFQYLEIIEEDYIIKDSKITNISSNTTKAEFEQKINLPMEYIILRDGKKIGKDEIIIATGDILKTDSGEEYVLIVAGDINKDGDVNIKDIVKMKKYLAETDNMNEIEMLAADCNLDGEEIGIKDLIRMRIIVLMRSRVV